MSQTTTTVRQRALATPPTPTPSTSAPVPAAMPVEPEVRPATARRTSKPYQCCILWPSRLLPALFGPHIYRLILYGTYFFWFAVGLFICRKTERATAAVRYVRWHKHTVSQSDIESSPLFNELVATFQRDFPRPPAILLLNQHALNMTFNFLCNTAVHPGVHERLVFVTLDQTARDVLQQHWPNVRQLYWPTPSLYKPFSFAEGPYQLIYLLRANLAVALLRRGQSFWMMQQDTFWRESLFDRQLEDDDSFDALFDQIGDKDDALRAEWVNGANFFVKANAHTLEFFEAIAAKLEHYYTPDMGIMIHQCHTWPTARCKFISHKIAHSWEWMYTDQSDPPAVMQLDCETDGRSKLQELAKFGFYFTEPDGRTCNSSAVAEAQQKMQAGQIEIGRHSWLNLSWGRFQFRVYWYLVDMMLWIPGIGWLIKPYLPLVGYVLMFTM